MRSTNLLRYDDGSIRIWDSRIILQSRLSEPWFTFNGHKSSITTLAFDGSGLQLASGAKDTDIILWDLLGGEQRVKLRGHKNQVTGLRFIQPQDTEAAQINDEADGLVNGAKTESERPGFLLTTSKDALIKLWDLSAQHCIETHVAQSNGECWALGISRDGDGCITAGNDGELRFWAIDRIGLGQVAAIVEQDPERRYLHSRGAIYRQGKDRTLGIHFRDGYIAAHGSDKAVEIWRIRSTAEVEKALARKKKRRREKAQKDLEAGKANDHVVDDETDETVATADISEFIISYVVVTTTGKVRSVDWAGSREGKSFQILVATTNNQLEVYDIPTRQKEKKSKSDEPPDYNRTYAVDLPGHRTDVRSVSLSSDDRMLASTSNGSLKIWNVRSKNCLRTLECGYALCTSFLPGDRIVIVGNRNGELELFDIASAALIDTVKAHDGPVWTLHVHPDGRSVVTGSADKSAKFWNFEIVQEEIPGTRRTTPRLKLVHTRTLKVNDDILSIRFSPDSRLLALSLLDNTVKVFFIDSLKLFLNLYGHKLPVLNLDISFDSKLIVTCSADKNVRIWGLDFGDCHKAFFAHQDSIMQVAFVPHNQDGNGHHFFSASKDRMIKYWDGDKFEQIQKLSGHHGEVWAMAVSRVGDFVVTASHDKSIRVWEQTDEQIFLEEEREREIEEMYEKTLTTSLEQEDGTGDDRAEAVDASKQTAETLMAGERIAEALDIGMEDLALMEEWRAQKALQPNTAPPRRHLIFMAHNISAEPLSAEQYVLNVIEKIQAAALQDALLVLTLEKVTALFTFISIWADRQWNMPLTCKVLFFMLKIHHRQIVSSKTMRPMLDDIRVKLRSSLKQQKDQMGLNLAALRIVEGRVKEKGTKNFVDEDVWREEEQRGKVGKKRAFVNVA